MQQPSDGISRELLPHIHLLSTYRYPLLPSIHPNKAADWLLNAPKIAAGAAPFYWTYLDRPQDGTVLLVWQSTLHETDFPSDGYIWAPGEMRYQIPVGTSILEMFHQKIGYAPGEPVATHTRRRYRLVSQVPGSAPVDPALWIVHYSQVAAAERISSQTIPISPQLQHAMATRQYLHSQGQIVQKDFMLNDRQNWPQIQFPRGPSRAPPTWNVPQARMPPTQYQVPHPAAGPPAKRPRTGPAGPLPHNDVDDEEETSRGDMFDLVTPREVSINRYKQNHEWMEEVLSSPYSLKQITPADLGLGVRGNLAALTEGIFDAPYDPDQDVAKYVYVGRLEHEKADQFRQRAADHIAQTNKEIEKMNAKHARRIARFKKNALLGDAERELRTAETDPADVGPEYWRLEGKVDEEDGEENNTSRKTPSKIGDILAQVEASLGRHAVAVQELRRIQEGGLQEAAPPMNSIPSPQKSVQRSISGGTPRSDGLANDVDMDMGNSAAGLLDQYHTGLSSVATPVSGFPTPQPQLQSHSAVGTPGVNIPSPLPTSHASLLPQAPAPKEVGNTNDIGASGEGVTGDWVVVPPGGVSPSSANATLPPATTLAPGISPRPTTTAGNTPAEFGAGSPNDFAELEDLDIAGEAMAGYGDMGGDMGEMGMSVDMDDSAFGEAFHGVEPREDADENHGDGM